MIKFNNAIHSVMMKEKIQYLALILVLINMISFAHSTTINDISDERVKNQLLNSSQLFVNEFNQISPSEVTNGNSIATVGGDINCTYSKGSNRIQTAIDTGNYSEIRVATNSTYSGSITINDIDIVIRGGYTNCTNAINNDQDVDLLTEINGIPSENKPVILIIGDNIRSNVYLENLEIKNGNGTGFSPGGGMLVVADAIIYLNRMNINNNDSSVGGGIYMIGENPDIIATDTIIRSNDANSAGGIYCAGENASIIMFGASAVSQNEATGNGKTTENGRGGGLYLTNGCDFLSYAQRTSGTFSIGGIVANKAINGAGIYADNGSMATLYGHEYCFDNQGVIRCYGSDDNPFSLGLNVAQEQGGGAYISGTDTQLNIYAGFVYSNRAELDTPAENSSEGAFLLYRGGGAVYAEDGASLLTGRLSENCWNRDQCNYYFGNTAKYSSGGAILNNNANIEIHSSLFENNRAKYGTVLLTEFADSSTRIESSIFHHNGNNGLDDSLDLSVFVTNANAKMDIIYSTIADNNAEQSVINIISGVISGTRVLSSIIDDASTGPVINSTSNNTSFFDCVIVHENSSLGTSLAVSTDDPKFKDRESRDYHLSAISSQILIPSPAIDYCGKRADVEHKDIDSQNHGYDDLSIDNNLGFYDIGADETYENEIIFVDGFEETEPD